MLACADIPSLLVVFTFKNPSLVLFHMATSFASETVVLLAVINKSLNYKQIEFMDFSQGPQHLEITTEARFRGQGSGIDMEV